MIIRDLRPFAITDGLGFAKMLEGFGMVVTLVYCSGFTYLLQLGVESSFSKPYCILP